MTDYRPSQEVLIELLGKNKASKIAKLGVIVVPDLINSGIAHADWRVRATAAKALGHLAAAHPEYNWAIASPSLVRGLEDSHPWVSANCAGALCNILDGGTELGLASSHERIRAIVALLKSAESQANAMKLLARIGAPAAAELLKILKGADYAWASDKMRDALVRIGMPAVPVLLKFLGSRLPSERDSAREIAFEALCGIAKAHPEENWRSALLVFSRYVKQESQWRNAAETLGAIAEKHPDYQWRDTVEAMAREIRVLGSRGAAETTAVLLEELVKIGTPSIPALLEGMKKAKKENDARGYAYALQRIGLEKIPNANDRVHCMLVLNMKDSIAKVGAPAILALVEGLKSPIPEMHQNAIDALAELGPAATPAVLPLLEVQDMYIRRNAVTALGRMGDASAIPALEKRIYDGDWGVRQNAIVALGKLGTSAVPALLRALKKGEDRPNVITALVEVAWNADIDLEAVRLALAEPVEEARKTAPKQAKAVERAAMRDYMRICEAAKKHAAEKYAQLGDGVMLEGERPRPPTGSRMFRSRRRAVA